MNTADLRAFFSTVLYEDMIQELRKLTSFELHEPEDQTTEIILLSCDLKMLKSANLSIKEIEDCIRDDKKELLHYSLKKHLQMYNEKTEEEYPKGEEQDEGDGDGDEKRLGYSKGFIFINTIEYIFAKKGKAELVEYLKKMRISKASKYAKQILTEFMP